MSRGDGSIITSYSHTPLHPHTFPTLSSRPGGPSSSLLHALVGTAALCSSAPLCMPWPRGQLLVPRGLPIMIPLAARADMNPFRNLSELTSGAPEQTTLPLATTYTAGTQPKVSGAPVLPQISISLADYPTPDQVPPTDSPLVQEWLSKVGLSHCLRILILSRST